MNPEMKKGKIRIFTTDPESLEKNSSRPSHWGKLVIPDGCKPGDTLKVALWRAVSQNKTNYLNGNIELDGYNETTSESKASETVSTDPF